MVEFDLAMFSVRLWDVNLLCPEASSITHRLYSDTFFINQTYSTSQYGKKDNCNFCLDIFLLTLPSVEHLQNQNDSFLYLERKNNSETTNDRDMWPMWRILLLVSHYAYEAWWNGRFYWLATHSRAVRQTCNLFSFLQERIAILCEDAVARWCGNWACVCDGLKLCGLRQLTATHRLMVCSLSTTFLRFPRRWAWPLPESNI